MSDASGGVVRFNFDLASAQAWYASLQPKAPGAITAFNTATFSGKTLYWVNGSGYQEGVFNPDGSLQASNVVTNGSPGVLTTVATWSVPADGTLHLVSTGGVTVIYMLISDNTSTRYYRTTKSSSGTTSVTTGWFYDQSTGLSQAQAFTTAGTQP
jgi:hypothetical protein